MNKDEQIVHEWMEMVINKQIPADFSDYTSFREFREFWLSREALDFNEALSLWRIKKNVASV